MIRRLAVLVAVAAAVLVSGAPGASALRPDPPGDGGSAPVRTMMPAKAYDADRVDHYQSGIAALRRATKRFHSLSAAQHAGYGFFTDAAGIACIDMPAMKGMGKGGMTGAGGMGVHFVKGALVDDPAEHPTQPEAMVYRVDKDGILRLAAVEYVVVQSAWDATHKSPPRLFGQKFSLTGADNRYGLPRVLLAARVGVAAQPRRHVRDVQPGRDLPSHRLITTVCRKSGASLGLLSPGSAGLPWGGSPDVTVFRHPLVNRQPGDRTSVAVRPLRCEGPLLEDAAAAVLVELQHPQVAPAVRGRVVDRDPDHRGQCVDGDDLARQVEALVRAVALGLPELPDGDQADQRRGPR